MPTMAAATRRVLATVDKIGIDICARSSDQATPHSGKPCRHLPNGNTLKMRDLGASVFSLAPWFAASLNLKKQ